MGGLARQAPAMAIFFVIIALANIALPLTNAFVGEFLMFNGLFNTFESRYGIWFTVMAGIGIILSAVYTLNMIRKIFYGETKTEIVGQDLRIGEKVALGIIVILILYMGICPQATLDLTESLSKELLEKVRDIKPAGPAIMN